MFMADLVRAIPRDLTCEFLGVPATAMRPFRPGSSRSPATSPRPSRAAVLLIEDIADTGLTLRYLHELLRTRGPASIHTCVLLAKSATGPANGGPGLDFVGFEAPTATSSATASTPASSTETCPGIAAWNPETTISPRAP